MSPTQRAVLEQLAQHAYVLTMDRIVVRIWMIQFHQIGAMAYPHHIRSVRGPTFEVLWGCGWLTWVEMPERLSYFIISASGVAALYGDGRCTALLVL